jgi:hypothetical protein
VHTMGKTHKHEKPEAAHDRKSDKQSKKTGNMIRKRNGKVAGLAMHLTHEN